MGMSRQCSRNSGTVVAALLLTVCMSGITVAENTAREPLVITSLRMDADKLGERVVFTGTVSLKKEGMTLSSDSMTVFYEAGSKRIREIEAHGNVVVRKDGRVALSNNAFYYNKEEKIILTGDAHIMENQNQLGGEKITLFMRDDRSIIESGKVTIIQDGQDAMPGMRKRK